MAVSDSDGVVCDNARGRFVSSVDNGSSDNFGVVFVVISNGVVSFNAKVIIFSDSASNISGIAGGGVVSDSECDISDIGKGFISDSDSDISDSAEGVIVPDSDIGSGDNEGDVFVLASDGCVSVSEKGVVF